MASYQATVLSRQPPEAVFDYLADFRSVAEWDPSITESVLLSADEPVTVGALYRVTTKTAVSTVVLDYAITDLDRPGLIKLRGENDSMISVDTIEIAAAEGGGSAVTYTAEIELKGARKLVDPLLELGFQRLGNKARDGLAAKLNED